MNDSKLNEYKQLVEENYTEPVKGKYDDATNSILKGIEIDDEEGEEESDEVVRHACESSQKEIKNVYFFPT